ncbi:2OG-Fe(II) oxygenase family protein [uncultured Thiodictyon sp.]|uniref:2OG-Fe(II) oxygenase family protein n=1 Tax=uncultured Thiodictyon sp. TaxID=1846217 RepID=UPI0025CFD0C2|nr:2OG-Fe(II) oxygenase family protein [uncultured Thiodictyon sp.]
MLTNPTHHGHPYPFFTVEPAFSPADCAHLEGVFAQDLPWLAHGGSFYEVRNCDATDRLAPAFLAALAERMRTLTGQPLTARVAATAQIMAPGAQIGVHTDRPLVGWETARLVMQFSRQWQPADGGVLQAHDDEAGSRVCASAPPRFNSAFGFVMHQGSYHSVTETTRLRQTFVFNFWHMGNTAELAVAVQTLFAHRQFGELTRLLDADRSTAEGSLPEEQTYRALIVATALQRWGLPDPVIRDGYRAATGLAAPPPTDCAAGVAIALAQWAAQLYVEDFDVAQWQRLSLAMAPLQQTDQSPLAVFSRVAFLPL